MTTSMWRRDGLFHMGVLDGLFWAAMGESLQMVLQWIVESRQQFAPLGGSTLYVLDLLLPEAPLKTLHVEYVAYL